MSRPNDNSISVSCFARFFSCSWQEMLAGPTLSLKPNQTGNSFRDVNESFVEQNGR